MPDVAVIGGGPAGMMAAGRAAELGASVLLLEKNPALGRKLLITEAAAATSPTRSPTPAPWLRTTAARGMPCCRRSASFRPRTPFGLRSRSRGADEGRGQPPGVSADDRAASVLAALERYLRQGRKLALGREVAGLETNPRRRDGISRYSGAAGAHRSAPHRWILRSWTSSSDLGRDGALRRQSSIMTLKGLDHPGLTGD